ncbi:MAG: hypothetical protein AABX40_04755 [Candidatus Hydrothermarchaeota archaeon]
MSKKLVYVAHTARVIEAAKRMMVGILTDRTIATGVVAEGKDPKEPHHRYPGDGPDGGFQAPGEV